MIFGLGGISALMALVLLVLAIRTHRRGLVDAPVEEDDIDDEDRGLSMDDDATGKLSSRFGAVLRPKDKKEIEELKNRVTQAGLYSRDAMDLYLTVRLSMLMGGMVLSMLVASSVEEPPVAVLFFCMVMGVAFVGPGIWLGSRAKERQNAILRSLPSTVELMVTCLDAGLGLEQAMERVSSKSRTGEDLLARELRMVLAEMKAGLETQVAWKKMAARIGLEDVNTLTAVVIQSAALGTNIAGMLRDHAKTMRQHRLLQLEEQAGKANAKLTLPLTTCLLPAVLILLLGPAVIMIMQSF